jgi:hypothetical protein
VKAAAVERKSFLLGKRSRARGWREKGERASTKQREGEKEKVGGGVEEERETQERGKGKEAALVF